MARYGYHGKILLLDVSDGSRQILEPDENWFRLYGGGGLLGTALLLRYTRPGLDAFDSRNLLALCSSVIAGNDAPGLARFSAVCKSPLSGGIAEARCEGAFGAALKASGFDCIALTGRADQPVGILIEDGDVRLTDASSLWGSDPEDVSLKCAEKFSLSRENVITTGIAGEQLVRYADLVCGGGNRAARLGTGAVLGSKNVKFLCIRGDRPVEAADPAALARIREEYARQMADNPLAMWQKEKPGFSAAADLSDFETAYMGEKNYQSDLSVGNSEYVRSAYSRYYRGEHPCPGCPGNCMKYIGTADGVSDESCIHQEVTGALGPNLGIRSLKTVLKGNELCGRYGLDCVSLGSVLGFVMECREAGVLTPEECGGMDLRFGDEKGILGAIEAIARREGFGRDMGEGVRRLSEKLGRKTAPYAMHVKGVEMVSFEPRTQTNLALGYAVAPYGPRYDVCEHDWDFDVVTGWEHTLNNSRALGILRRVPMQELSPEKVRNFTALYTLWRACDTLNLCIFASAPTRVYSLEAMAELVRAVTGWKTSSYELMNYGSRTNTLMRVYNLREGLSCRDDMLPERFFREPVQFGRLKGTCLDRGAFLRMRGLYYAMCGWDDRGVPTEAALAAAGLTEYEGSLR